MQPENAFALCPAVAYGHVAIVKMLVDSGVDVNVGPKCFKRATPLELARKRVFSEIVVLLEAAGAK
jgi:ankyrin repeat protein